MYFPTNLNKNPNQEMELSSLISIVEKIPSQFLSNLYIYLQPRDIVNFSCSCTTIKNIDNQYRSRHPIAYDELITQARFNSLKERSIEQLSIDMIDFCTSHKIKELQILMRFLFLYKKFNELPIEKLSLFFELVAGYGYVDIIESIINSIRYKEIPIEQIGIALGLASDVGHLEIIESIMNSTRFKEIPIEHISVALELASGKCHLEIVQSLNKV